MQKVVQLKTVKKQTKVTKSNIGEADLMSEEEVRKIVMVWMCCILLVFSEDLGLLEEFFLKVGMPLLC